MNYTERRIVESYTGLFEGLSTLSKMELIKKLSRSLTIENNTKEDDFYKSYGAFPSEKSAEEIIKDIKDSRKFRNKEIKF